MRTNIFAQHLRSLSKAGALIAIATLATACSNDAARFDSLVTSSIPETSNQQKIINRSAGQDNDNEIQIVRSQSDVGYSAPEKTAPSVTRSNLPAASYSEPAIESTIEDEGSVIQYTGVPSLPKESSTNSVVVLPQRENNTALRMIDTATTGSIKKAVPALSASKSAGWKNAKGAWVTVKKGETLYNMSRRYGVPVTAIMGVNKIKNASSVTVGQKILIPAYNYAATAPVSAADNNPITKASRGFQEKARGKVSVPMARAERVVKDSKAVVEKTVAMKTLATKTVTGSAYLVQSGDTLFGVARRHGMSAATLRNANSLKSDSLRIGQQLQIPNTEPKIISVKKKTPAPTVLIDKQTTASIGSKDKKVKRIKPVYSAPKAVPTIEKRATEDVASVAKASAGSFRWPARGRLISKFGSNTPTGANDGIDISMPIGTPIKASENGTVIYSGSELEDFGNLVLVSHEGGWVTAYGHASAILVRRGDKVRRGQVIAKSGKTGNAKAPKLHFELRKNSRPVNPLKHMTK